jgi:sulfhydrogenase subunit gamma (sulfur reductase)
MKEHDCRHGRNTDSGKPHNHETQVPVMMRIISKKDLTPDVRFFQTVPTKEYRYENLDYRPGQFMSLSIPGAGDAPFSVTSSPTRKGIIEFAIRKVGRFTEKIFTLKDGDLLIYLYGARNVEDMLYKEDFFELLKSDQIELQLIVDENNEGYEDRIKKGRVTELFSGIGKFDPENTVAAVCGPPVMYKFVVQELLKLDMYKNDIYLSLERRMKCGVGKCGHCIIDYVYTCIDGPVFTYWDVLNMIDLI